MPFSPDTSSSLLIRCARIMRGWRLREMADATGYSVPYPSLVERCRRRLTPRVAEKISRALGEEGRR